MLVLQVTSERWCLNKARGRETLAGIHQSQAALSNREDELLQLRSHGFITGTSSL